VNGLELTGEVTKPLHADLAALEEIDKTLHSSGAFPAATLELFLL
jgi:hypothetical protein